MRETIRYGFILGLICLVAAGLLARVNSLTESRIISQAQAEENSSLNEVMPEAAGFEEVKSGEEIIYYKALNKDGRLIGAVFKTQGKGYSGMIETMSGMLLNGSITAIKILSQNETPGLGTRVAEQEFTVKFKGKKLQDLKDIQAITGATVSSRAVIDSVNKKAGQIKELLERE